MLRATPQGFLKAARTNHATITSTHEGTAVSFAIAGNHTMTGVVDAQHHLVRVHTQVDQSIVGDMLVVSANPKSAVTRSAAATNSAPPPAMDGVKSQEVADGVFSVDWWLASQSGDCDA